MKNGFKAIAREYQAWSLRAKVLDNRHCFAAPPFPCESQYALQLHFNPDLAHVGTALFARKKAIVKQIGCSLKISGLSQVQNQFEYKCRRRSIKLRVLFQSLHPFTSRPVQQTERLIHADVKRDVGGIAAQPSTENSERVLRVILYVQESQARARVYNRKLGPKLASFRPFVQR